MKEFSKCGASKNLRFTASHNLGSTMCRKNYILFQIATKAKRVYALLRSNAKFLSIEA
jgi:hypothetical protein